MLKRVEERIISRKPTLVEWQELIELETHKNTSSLIPLPQGSALLLAIRFLPLP